MKLRDDARPAELEHKVKLLGAKTGFNFFTVACTPEGELTQKKLAGTSPGFPEGGVQLWVVMGGGCGRGCLLKLREYTFNSLALMITGIINIDGYNATPYFTRLQHCGSSRDSCIQ